ncbi:MAG: hypothetical protein N2749_04090 [Clostridia bacterium]|nr:hypothetical protein [Clostridia bacterium]
MLWKRSKTRKKVDEFVAIGERKKNINIVIFNKNSFFEIITHEIWKNAIKEHIGEGILKDSCTLYLVSCITKKEKIEFLIFGTFILDFIWKSIENEKLARINITRMPMEKHKQDSWIFVRN